mgnify:CR=1 FL=1
MQRSGQTESEQSMHPFCDESLVGLLHWCTSFQFSRRSHAITMLTQQALRICSRGEFHVRCTCAVLSCDATAKHYGSWCSIWEECSETYSGTLITLESAPAFCIFTIFSCSPLSHSNISKKTCFGSSSEVPHFCSDGKTNVLALFLKVGRPWAPLSGSKTRVFLLGAPPRRTLHFALLMVKSVLFLVSGFGFWFSGLGFRV